MRSNALLLWLACALAGLSGCAKSRSGVAHHRPMDEKHSLDAARRSVASESTDQPRTLDATASGSVPRASQESPALEARPVSHAVESSVLSRATERSDATLKIAGRTYRLQLLEESEGEARAVSEAIAGGDHESLVSIGALPAADTVPSAAATDMEAEAVTPRSSPGLRLNLPTALSMVGGRHPAVGFAQWRVQEAYARLDRAQVLWLPSIQPGFSFHRHDGNYQASNGAVVDANRNSFQFGLGSGATGAGTTPRPGVVAQFHLADAIFQPKIERKTAWARGHAANGVVNEQLFTVALAYLQLLESVQDVQIVEMAKERTSELSKLTRDFAVAGQGLQADADRLHTELQLVEDRLATAQERVEVASAQLAQALSVDARQLISPLDPTVVPIDLAPPDIDRDVLIQTGLKTRPELKEAQALVAAACEQYRRQKYAPFVPSVLLGFSTGGFGGGLGNNLDSIDDRYDFDALLAWEVRNLGLGEGSARRESAALLEQAKYRKVRVLDRVAREVAEAHAQTIHRARRIEITQSAIQSAEDSYRRNLGRIRDGQGLPLEVLQSVRALEDARRAYLKAIVQYNRAQFRLQWALGWPVSAFEG